MLHDVRASTAYKEKSSEHFKDIYKLKLLANFNLDLTSSSKESYKLNVYILLVTLPRNKQPAKTRRKECHEFWLHLRHTLILISNDRTSASKKIYRMALIRALTVSTSAFERKKEELYGFRQIVRSD